MRGGARSCAGRREKGASEPVKYYRDTSQMLQRNITGIQVSKLNVTGKYYREILERYK